MRILLDTHMLLALIDQRAFPLPRGMEDIWQTPALEALVSVASLWEIAIKTRLGKLGLAIPVSEIPNQLASAEVAILSVTADHALYELDPLPETRDPFDRLLLAVAAVEGAPLLTIDDKLRDHPNAWRGGS